MTTRSNNAAMSHRRCSQESGLSIRRLTWWIAVSLAVMSLIGCVQLSPAGNATAEPSPTVSPTADSSSGTPAPESSCQVVVEVGLRLRRGPGTNYDPIDVLPIDTRLTPEGRAPDGQWLLMLVPNSNQRGWVSAAPALVSCAVAIAELPIVEITSPSTTVPDPPSPQPSATPSPAAGSPLQRQEPPPEGVAEQLGYGAGGFIFFPCTPETAPRVFSRSEVEILETLLVCVTGFAADQRVSMTLARPDGTMLSQERAVTDDQGTVIWDGVIHSNEPLGEYTVSVTQPGLQASATFNVIAASRPRIRVHPETGPPGTAFQVDLAGFPAGQPVPLYLYREDKAQNVWVYQTELPVIQADDRGEAIYSLNTQPDDPAGSYRIVTVPPVVSIQFNSESRFMVAP